MHKRALGAAAVTGVAALALSACGGSSPTTPSNTGAAGTSKATSSGVPETPSGTAAPVRDANVDLVIWTDADRSKAVQKYADQFAAENGVSVKVQISTDTRAQFKDATKVGKGPDVIVGAHDWLGELVQNSTVAPVSLSLRRRGEVPAEGHRRRRSSTASPTACPTPSRTSASCTTRTSSRTRPRPWTSSSPPARSSSRRARPSRSCRSSSPRSATPTSPTRTSRPSPTAASSPSKPNGDYDPNKVIVNSAGSVKGGEVLAELGKKKVLSTNVDDTNQDALFDTKAAPFMISGPWSVAKAKEAGINYGIAPLPSLTGGGAMQPFLGVQMFYVSSKAKNATLAQEFVTNYIPRKDVQLALFEVGKRPPALKEAYDQVAATRPRRQGLVRGRHRGRADAEHPRDELGLGPLRPGDR